MKQPPLQDKIERRFGKVIVFFKEKEDMFFYHLSADTERGRPHIVSYDDMAKLFNYNGKKYTEREFAKVLDLFAFS